MRATATFVVFSSLLSAATAIAQPGAAGGAGTGPGSAPAPSPSPSGTQGGGPAAAAPTPDPASVRPEEMPTSVRMRRLEQRTQALKERAWQLKARVQMLKEQVIGGGVGAQSLIAHANEMGTSFRLIKLSYQLDGTQIFVRSEDSDPNLWKAKALDVFTGPIAPGNHSLSIVATYRGHGYGLFEYLTNYEFTARGNQAFMAGEGKLAKLDCRGYEKGGPTMPHEKRPAIACKVTAVSPDKPDDAPTSSAPPTTSTNSSAPLAPATPAPTTPGK